MSKHIFVDRVYKCTLSNSFISNKEQIQVTQIDNDNVYCKRIHDSMTFQFPANKFFFHFKYDNKDKRNISLQKELVLSFYYECDGDHTQIAKKVGLTSGRVGSIFQEVYQIATEERIFKIQNQKSILEHIQQLASDHSIEEVVTILNISKRTLNKLQSIHNIKFKVTKKVKYKYSTDQLIRAYNRCNQNYGSMDRFFDQKLGSAAKMMKGLKLDKIYPNIRISYDI